MTVHDRCRLVVFRNDSNILMVDTLWRETALPCVTIEREEKRGGDAVDRDKIIK